MIIRMEHKTITYLLDAFSGTSFIGAIFTGNTVLAILGGVASIAAIINHVDQVMKRNKK